MDEFEEFTEQMRGAIDEGFAFAAKQDDPAVLVFVVGASKPPRGAPGVPGAVVHAVHGMSAAAIADTLLSVMSNQPELPISKALTVILQNRDLIKDHPAMRGVDLGGDNDDEFGGLMHLNDEDL